MEDTQRRGFARLLLRWPGKRKELVRRAQTDAHIGELCEAYESACAALDHWLHSSATVAPDRIEEYRMLVEATEQDILTLISLSTHSQA